MHKVTARQKPGRLRIIGGEWRGRKLDVPSVPGLRPTADRIRETLFNWLREQTPGARCLDLFAGSGALGWEALSRGARHATFVDQDRTAIHGLRAVQEKLGAAATLVQADVGAWLADGPADFDIVFADPPYEFPLVELLPRVWPSLKDGGRIYVERNSSEALDEMTTHGEFSHRARAGQVHYGLLSRRP